MKAASAAQNTVLLRRSAARISKRQRRENKAEEAKVFIQVSRRHQSERAAPQPKVVPAEQARLSRGACAANLQLFHAESFINASSCVFVLFCFWHKSTPNLSPLNTFWFVSFTKYVSCHFPNCIHSQNGLVKQF